MCHEFRENLSGHSNVEIEEHNVSFLDVIEANSISRKTMYCTYNVYTGARSCNFNTSSAVRTA